MKKHANTRARQQQQQEQQQRFRNLVYKKMRVANVMSSLQTECTII
jgi:hypothetical protein